VLRRQGRSRVSRLAVTPYPQHGYSDKPTNEYGRTDFYVVGEMPPLPKTDSWRLLSDRTILTTVASFGLVSAENVVAVELQESHPFGQPFHLGLFSRPWKTGAGEQKRRPTLPSHPNDDHRMGPPS